MSGAAFFISFHGQDTHLFLCPAISASPWLQKVDVTVESVVGKGFWSIFRVVIWLWEVQEGKIKPHMLLCFTKTIPTRTCVLAKSSADRPRFIYRETEWKQCTDPPAEMEEKGKRQEEETGAKYCYNRYCSFRWKPKHNKDFKVLANCLLKYCDTMKSWRNECIISSMM